MFNVQRPQAYATAHFGGSTSAFRVHVPNQLPLGSPTTANGHLVAGLPMGDSPLSPTAQLLANGPIQLFTGTQSAPASPVDSRATKATTAAGLCSICGDKATGKHYGANSCDGCKGFFRRTVRSKQRDRYICRFARNCVIDKDNRNSCRYCRFRKCVAAGMKTEAVQNERDRITTRRSSSVNTTNSSIDLLLNAEQQCAQLRNSVIQCSISAKPELHSGQPADFGDITDSIKQQLLLLVEWAKMVPPFPALNMDDQVVLLRAYAAVHLMLTVTRRSLQYKDMLILSNETWIGRGQSPHWQDITFHVEKILDELVDPMKELQLDDEEYVLMKAIIFFNPYGRGLKQKSVVKEMRETLLAALETYILEKPNSVRGRISNILLLIPSLQGISKLVVESVHVATVFGFAMADNLIQEMLLSEVEEQSNQAVVSMSSPSVTPMEQSQSATYETSPVS